MSDNGKSHALRIKIQENIILKQRIEQQQADIDRLENECDELDTKIEQLDYHCHALAATIESLRDAFTKATTLGHMEQAFRETPQQSLAEHDAEVARRAFIACFKETTERFNGDWYDECEKELESYANEYANKIKAGDL